MRTALYLFLLLTFSLSGFSAEEKKEGLPSDDNEVRVSRGLRYSVPKDWPMDKRNGGISPVPTEDYMLMKFKKIDERLDALEKQMNQKTTSVPEEIKQILTPQRGHLQSFEYKRATLEGEGKENEKTSS